MAILEFKLSGLDEKYQAADGGNFDTLICNYLKIVKPKKDWETPLNAPKLKNRNARKPLNTP